MSTENDPLLGATVAGETSDNTTVAGETSDNSTTSERSIGTVQKIVLVSAPLLAYLLIGANVFVLLWYGFKSTPITPYQLHIILSVIGYQLLMSHGILCLNSYVGWSPYLTVLHRRRIHWILQLVGSVLAIAGSVIMMLQKDINFNTVHGRLALAALILVCISLMNGVTTLYRARVSRSVRAEAIKTSHLFIGSAAFAVSSVSLAYGYRKKAFLEWASSELSWTMISITCVYTLIVIAKTCYVLWKKLTEVIKIKIF